MITLDNTKTQGTDTRARPFTLSRHTFIVSLPLILWLMLSISIPTVLAQQASGKEAVKAVEAIGMTVSDMDTSVEFYSKVLYFKNVS